MTEPLNPLPPLPADIAAMTYEQAMGELETIVRQLESGQGQLDQAIAAYERGSFLRRHCEAKLREAESRIDRITKLADGSLATSPVEIG